MKIPGRPPVNPADKVRRQPSQGGSKIVFDAQWDVTQAPPNTEVGITAISTIAIEGATAQIRIFHVAGKSYTPVTVFHSPFENGRVKTKWRTTPIKGGNFEVGEYYFEVTVNSYLGITSHGLVLRDATQRNQSSFQAAAPKPKVVL